MKPFALLAAAAISAAPISHAAFAQAPAPLAYVQAVPPAGVQTVQNSLRRAGNYTGAVDGVWGADSISALQRFQANHQLQVTGQLNQATLAALGIDPTALLGTPQFAAAPPPPPAENLQPASVRAVQARLRDLGFYTGAVDGVWGQSTQSAVGQFQANRGLQPNGVLSTPTVTAMGLPPDSLAYR
jgi:peptidoglycan hydrolase-like protein with peptidoglycan-binding domain